MQIMSYIVQGKKEGRVLVYREVPGMEGHYVPLTIFEGIEPVPRVVTENTMRRGFAPVEEGDL